MKLLWVGMMCLLPVARGEGYRIHAVEASGEEAAVLLFRTDGVPKDVPRFQVRDNTLELVFVGASLAEDASKIEKGSPHVLVSRVSVFPSAGEGVKAVVVVNGSLEKLKDRIRLERSDRGIVLQVRPPEGANPTLALLKEEQQPLAAETLTAQSKSGRGWGGFIVFGLVFSAMVAVGVGGFLTLKKRGRFGGSRRHLAEQVSYCPVGPGGKAGVGVVRVGAEFFLVGIGSGGVTLLSALPKMAEDYKNETKYERETFAAAVADEVSRLRKGKEYSA